MSIKAEAHNFHRKIWNSPNREEIKTVVGKLKSSSRGYGNNIYPTPMLGLLLWDQHLLKKFAGKAATEELASWSDRELKILFGVHNQVRLLNQRCLSPLMTALPEVISAVNPYKEYPDSVSTEGFEEFLFKQEDAVEIIESFQNHPAFEMALSNLSIVKKQPLNYDQTIWQLNREIVGAGPGGEPQWFTNYETARRSDHPSVDVFRHVAALICLHNSLANLSQYIYQGLFQPELIPINRTRIVDYLWKFGGVGQGIWLMHIPYGYMYSFEVTDLIIVNVDKPGEKERHGDALCSIHSQTIPGTEITPGILKLSVINDDLNAYGYLVR